MGATLDFSQDSHHYLAATATFCCQKQFYFYFSLSRRIIASGFQDVVFHSAYQGVTLSASDLFVAVCIFALQDTFFPKAMSQQMVDKYYYVLTRKTQERQVFL
ncbi:MAG: hypothetical protein J6C23_06370 [Clostridia bacterium]|nr:hypothetical protein [Clostridia bacterium]